MKTSTVLAALMLLLSLSTGSATAQGVATPLTIQGVDHAVEVGARARAMGGAHTGSVLGSSSMFFDPAGLASMDQAEVRIGGFTRSKTYEQRQEWMPNRIYVELSLIMENNPAAVNQPFDDIRPAWERSQSDTRPSIISGAIPVRLGNMTLVAGMGYATVVDLDHYFQNNNVLDPNVGRLRPEPIPRVTPGDSLMVEWYQHTRERTGFISAFTPALALRVMDGISIGASVSILSGSSEDFESRRDRGVLTLKHNNDLQLNPAGFTGSWSGSSDFSGTYATFSGRYATPYFQTGVAVRTPFELTRDWERSGSVDPDGGSSSGSGSDVIEMPLMVSVGVSLMPTERWLLSATMDRRAFDDVTYRPTGATDLSPWVSGNAIRLGVQFQAMPWLALRGGYGDTAETFAAEGAGLMNEPVRSRSYSAGLGFTYDRFGIDLAYQYASTSYEDRWLSNVNFNDVRQSSFVFETYVRF